MFCAKETPQIDGRDNVNMERGTCCDNFLCKLFTDKGRSTVQLPSFDPRNGKMEFYGEKCMIGCVESDGEMIRTMWWVWSAKELLQTDGICDVKMKTGTLYKNSLDVIHRRMPSFTSSFLPYFPPSASSACWTSSCEAVVRGHCYGDDDGGGLIPAQQWCPTI